MHSFSFPGTAQTLGERSESVGSSLCFLPPFNLHHSFSMVVLPDLSHRQTHAPTPKMNPIACHFESSSISLFLLSSLFPSGINPCVRWNYFRFHFSPKCHAIANPACMFSEYSDGISEIGPDLILPVWLLKIPCWHHGAAVNMGSCFWISGWWPKWDS